MVDTSNLVDNRSTYEWAGEEPAELVYRLPVDWAYTGNRAASWTLLEHRSPSIRAGSAVDIREQIDIAGDGYVGNRTLLYRPSRDQLADVYSYDAPQMQIQTTSVSAAGRAWTRSLDGQDVQLRLGLNETLRVGARVTNAGDAAGVASLAPRVSAEEGVLDRVDSPWIGRLQPAETLNRTATHRFDHPGTYELTVGARSYSVTAVPDRGTASVTRLNVSHSPADGRVVVNATVRNDGSRATFAALPVSLDGQRVATTGVVIDGGVNRTETVRIDASEPTPYTITVGGQSATEPSETRSEP